MKITINLETKDDGYRINVTPLYSNSFPRIAVYAHLMRKANASKSILSYYLVQEQHLGSV